MIINNLQQKIKFLQFFLKFFPIQQPFIGVESPLNSEKTKLEVKQEKILKKKQLFITINFILNCGIIGVHNLMLCIASIVHACGKNYTPVFISTKQGYNIQLICTMIIRIIISLIYVINYKNRWRVLYLSSKVLQLISLFFFREPIVIIAIIPETAADIVYVFTKDKRSTSFDSRFNYQYFIIRLLTISLCMIGFNSTIPSSLTGQQNQSILFFFFVGTILNCTFLNYQTIYHLKMKKFQLYTHYIISAYVAYLYCVYTALVEAQVTIENIRAFFLPIPIILIIYCFLLSFQYLPTRLEKNYLRYNFNQLNSQQKVQYIWQAFYFIEYAEQILKNQNKIAEKMNINSQIAQLLIRYEQQSVGEQCTFSVPESQSFKNKIEIFKERFPNNDVITIYKKMIQRLIYTQSRNSSVFRQISLFYGDRYMSRYADCEPHEVLFEYDNFLDAFFEARQNQRVKKQKCSLQTDIAVQIMQTKGIELKTKNNIFEYFSHYKNLLNLLLSEEINMSYCYSLVKKIKQLQTQFIHLGELRLRKKTKNSSNQQLQQGLDSQKKIQLKKKDQKPLKNRSHKVLSSFTISMLNLVRQYIIDDNYIVVPIQKYDIKKSIKDEEIPMIVASGQTSEIGKIVTGNQAACKMTLYLLHELKAEAIKLLMPKFIHGIHNKILEKASLKNTDDSRQISPMIYIVKKTGYSTACKLFVKSSFGQLGQKWFITFKQICKPQDSIIICDQNGILLDMNQCAALLLDITLEDKGKDFGTLFIKYIQECGNFCTQDLTSRTKKRIFCELINDVKELKAKKVPLFYIIQLKLYQIPKDDNIEIIQASKSSLCHNNLPEFTYNVNLNQFSYAKEQTIQQSVMQQSFINYSHIIDETIKINWSKDYAEGISQLIYINNQVQFRENKNLEMKLKCDSYPPHSQQAKQYRKLLLQTPLPGKEDIKEEVQNCFSDVNYSIKAITIIFISCGVLSIMLSIISIFIANNTIYITEKRMKMTLILQQIAENYEEVGFIIMENFDEKLSFQLQFAKINLLNHHEDTSAIVVNFQSIEKLFSQLFEIDSHIQTYFSQRYDGKIKYINSDESFKLISNNLKISFLDYLSQIQSISLEYKFARILSLLEQIIHKVIPILYYEKQLIGDDYHNQLIDQLQILRILIYAFTALITVFGLISIYHKNLLNNNRIKIFKIYSTFSEPQLCDFLTRLETIQSSVSSEQPDLISLKPIEEDQLQQPGIIFHYKKIKHKKTLIQNKIGTFKYFFIIIVLGLMQSSTLFIAEQISQIQNLTQFAEIQIQDKQYLNQIWFNKMILILNRQKSNFSIDYENQMKEKIDYLIDNRFEKIRKTKKKFSKSLFHNQFTQKFKKDYENTMLTNLCTVLQNYKQYDDIISACPPIINGYKITTIGAYNAIKQINTITMFDKYYKKSIDDGQIELFAQLNKDLVLTVKIYEGKILQLIRNVAHQQLLNRKQVQLVQQIVFSTIFLILMVSLCFLFARQIKSQRQYAYQPFMLATQIFPFALLNKNQYYKFLFFCDKTQRK